MSKPSEQTHICRRCGRKLRSDDAKRRGMGYVCHQKWMAENGKKKLFVVSSLQPPKNGV